MDIIGREVAWFRTYKPAKYQLVEISTKSEFWGNVTVF